MVFFPHGIERVRSFTMFKLVGIIGIGKCRIECLEQFFRIFAEGPARHLSSCTINAREGSGRFIVHIHLLTASPVATVEDNIVISVLYKDKLISICFKIRDTYHRVG